MPWVQLAEVIRGGWQSLLLLRPVGRWSCTLFDVDSSVKHSQRFPEWRVQPALMALCLTPVLLSIIGSWSAVLSPPFSNVLDGMKDLHAKDEISF